jgi:cell division protease FtsH
LKNNLLKNILLWSVVAMLLLWLYQHTGAGNPYKTNIEFSTFLKQVEQQKVAKVTINSEKHLMLVDAKEASGTIPAKYTVVYSPGLMDSKLISHFNKNGVAEYGVKMQKEPSMPLNILLSWLPFIILIGIWLFIMRQMQGGSGKGGPMSFGRSKAKLLGEDQIKITFDDVAGVEEAKHEVSELVEFLRDPGRFQKLGGKMPCGVLLVGSPGTGKTLLAKAVAGEAKVPFFTISGSDFVEMFVGVGASRVRDMFEQAKRRAPCIIFIDEIDAVGRHRGAGLGGGHDEREQTLNQLLVEMDGFEGKEGIIIMAATNRPDVLDPALLRPGRFDRQVVVPLPDIKGREKILEVHMRKVPIDRNVRACVLARGTPGFSGADLANLVNEAALFAARENKRLVHMVDFERAKDKILMGSERRSMVMSEQEKRLTAYHEAGHAIVGLNVPEHDPVYKVSIIPRGRALGVTMFLPEQDRYSYTKRRLLSQLCGLYGGRIAEEMIFGADSVTTGASNDIERATEIARNMVTKWGLSELLGPVTYGEEQGEVFLGRNMSQRQEISAETSNTIDKEVRRLLDESYATAKNILEENKQYLHLMSEALMKFETIDQSQIAEIMEGKEPTPPEDWDEDGNSNTKASNPKSSPDPTTGTFLGEQTDV